MIDDFLVPPFWVVAEWPEKVADWLPASALHLELERRPDHRHHFRLRA